MIFLCPTTHTSLSTIPQLSSPLSVFSDLLDNIYIIACHLKAKPLAMLDLLPSASAWTTTFASNSCPRGDV